MPLDLLIQMPPPELKELELLLDVLASCESFRVTSREGGMIIRRLDEDGRRDSCRVHDKGEARDSWEGNDSLSGLRPPHDLHLACSMQLVDNESRWLAVNNYGKERVEVCLSSYFRLSPAEGRRWDWEEYDLQIESGRGPLMEIVEPLQSKISLLSSLLLTHRVAGPSGPSPVSRTPRNVHTRLRATDLSLRIRGVLARVHDGSERLGTGTTSSNQPFSGRGF